MVQEADNADKRMSGQQPPGRASATLPAARGPSNTVKLDKSKPSGPQAESIMPPALAAADETASVATPLIRGPVRTLDKAKQATRAPGGSLDDAGTPDNLKDWAGPSNSRGLEHQELVQDAWPGLSHAPASRAEAVDKPNESAGSATSTSHGSQPAPLPRPSPVPLV